jgi:hypothetical protein
MGAIGNVVVNAVVRTLTRKGVGKAMKSARSANGKRKKSGPKKGSANGKQRGARSVSWPGVEKRGGIQVGS